MHRIWVAWLVLAMLAPSAGADSRCVSIAKALTVTPVVGTVKTITYPAVFGAKLAPTLFRQPSKLVEQAKKILWQDKIAAGIYGLSAVLYRSTGISFNQLENETHEFFEADPDELFVIVDGFPSTDKLYYGIGTYFYEQTQKHKSNVVLINDVRDWAHILERLQDVVEQRGKIKKFMFFGHGFPGKLEGGDQWAKHFPFYESGKFEVFKKDAKLLFVSCFFGNGNYGEQLMEKLQSNAIPRGGTVWVSNVQVVANLLELTTAKRGMKDPGKALRNAAEPFSTFLGFWTVGSWFDVWADIDKEQTMEGPFFLHRTRKVEIAPLADFAEIPDAEGVEFMHDIFTVTNRQLGLLLEGRRSVSQFDDTHRPIRANNFIVHHHGVAYSQPLTWQYAQPRRSPQVTSRLYRRAETEFRHYYGSEKLMNLPEAIAFVDTMINLRKDDLESIYRASIERLNQRKEDFNQMAAAADAKEFFDNALEYLRGATRNQILAGSSF